MTADPSRSRRIAAVLLSVLAAISSIAATFAWFLHGEVLDTDRYVETMSAVAADPAVQAALTDRITTALTAELDLDSVAVTALRSLDENVPGVPTAVVGLAPVLADQAHEYVRRTVERFVASDRFASLWAAANRNAHRTLAATLTGDTAIGARIDDSGSLAVDLGPAVDRVRSELTQRGFTFAERIPDTDRSFVIARSPALAKAQALVSALNTAAIALPLLTVALAAAAILIAPKGFRPGTVSVLGVGLMIAMAVTAATVAILRATYLNALPPEQLSVPVATAVLDTLLSRLHTALRFLFLIGALATVIAYLSGPSAATLRHRATAALARSTA